MDGLLKLCLGAGLEYPYGRVDGQHFALHLVHDGRVVVRLLPRAEVAPQAPFPRAPHLVILLQLAPQVVDAHGFW